MKGVDISHYQKGLTIRQIRDAGYGFAVIKLTEGSSFIDTAAFDFYREAYELKFPLGCYCYSHADSAEAARGEATFLLRTIKGFPMPCGVFLDMEEPKQLGLSVEQIRELAEAWCDVIRHAGYVPGIYGSEYTLWAKLAPKMLKPDTLIWIAHYGREPKMPGDLWQSDDCGCITGYTEKVDINEVRSARFEALVKQGIESAAHKEPGRPEAAVAVLQLLMHGDGFWEEADGIKSPAFFTKLREYIDNLEAG